MGKRKREQEQGADSAPVEDAFEAALAAYFRAVIAAQLVAELHCKKPLVCHVHHGDGTKRVQIDRPVPLAEAYAGFCPGEDFPPREVIERLQAVEHTDIDACHRWVEDVYKEARALLDPIVADGFLRMPGCPPVARVGEQYMRWLKRLEAGYLEFGKDVLTGRPKWRKHGHQQAKPAQQPLGNAMVSQPVPMAEVPAQYRNRGRPDGEPLTGAFVESRFHIPQGTTRRLACRLEAIEALGTTRRGERKVNVYSWRSVLAYKTELQEREAPPDE